MLYLFETLATTCQTKAQLKYSGINFDINVQEQCPVDMKCLDVPFNEFLDNYSFLIPEEYQQYLDLIKTYATIQQLEMCNIWPADGCSQGNLQSCNYFKECIATCSDTCVYSNKAFTRTITPNITIQVIKPITFIQEGMLYCGSKQDDQPKSNLSTGAGIGIAIGVIIGLLVIIAVAFYVIKRNKSSKAYGIKTTTMTNAYI
ncbi:Hypothetical_protein [Hexamita inflata]|uniref:Hypothetical_protein n=1 Tax=Hexamita inflata TaxID=28002 RepID=A0AA86Q4U2_9EUKA|nr:Hypothetical protein HINF_LOCUS38186 [Hexamita inflata]